jgi:hypothetical protein
MAKKGLTIDPTQISSPSEIPPPGADPTGLSPQGLVEVYAGTLAGDTDALPAAKELLGPALDTGGLSNADYIYNQVSALYGEKQLPDFQSPAGNKVKSLVFVSGSGQGGFGAFHISGSQAEFDRIVVDSLDASGSYSPGSGLGSALAPLTTKAPHLFPIYRGAEDLLGVTHSGDPRLKSAKEAAIRDALVFASRSTSALKTAIETRNASAIPPTISAHTSRTSAKEEVSELTRSLIQANQATAGLLDVAMAAISGRQYLSTALFAAEIVESFQMLTRKADAGKTDGEAVSRVLGFKLAPEIALIPGFNSAVTQQWWNDGHPDLVNVNTENDQSTDGNGAGMMFLEFLTDYLGVSMDQILESMPATNGAALGETYVKLLNDHPELGLVQVAGRDGKAAFQKMVSLIEQNTQSPDGSLNLPADGNPFPSMPGANQGGLFAGKPLIVSTGALAQDAQAALLLEAQVEQQAAALKAVLQQIRGDAAAGPTAATARVKARQEAFDAGFKAAYGPPLLTTVLANLDQKVAQFRAPHYDQTLQEEFWPHVYNELPGTGPHVDRLQVITGTNQAPVALQITGTITQTKAEKDGDLHISFQPDDSNFPTNQDGKEPPLELEIIYAGPVTQPDAKQAEKGYTNPFDIKALVPGTRIQAAGPLIFDRAHGKVDAAGNVQFGLEIHPLAGIIVLSGTPVVPPPPPPPPNAGQLSADLASALSQAGTLGQTLGNLSSLIQKMKEEAPVS